MVSLCADSSLISATGFAPPIWNLVRASQKQPQEHLLDHFHFTGDLPFGSDRTPLRRITVEMCSLEVRKMHENKGGSRCGGAIAALREPIRS